MVDVIRVEMRVPAVTFIGEVKSHLGAFLVAQMVKNSPAMRKTWVGSLGLEDPWIREWLPTPVFLPRELPWTEDPGKL